MPSSFEQAEIDRELADLMSWPTPSPRCRDAVTRAVREQLATFDLIAHCISRDSTVLSSYRDSLQETQSDSADVSRGSSGTADTQLTHSGCSRCGHVSSRPNFTRQQRRNQKSKARSHAKRNKGRIAKGKKKTTERVEQAIQAGANEILRNDGKGSE